MVCVLYSLIVSRETYYFEKIPDNTLYYKIVSGNIILSKDRITLKRRKRKNEMD